MVWRSPKGRETIEGWEITEMFGLPMLTGYGEDGRRICQHLWWWANARFGTEAGVFKEGTPRLARWRQ